MSAPINPDSCSQCVSYRNRRAKQNIFVVHTQREVICAGKRSPDKKRLLQRLEKIVSALRNSGGGQVVVHIEGQKDDDRYLEHVDEFITKHFTDLIEDGQLYVEAFDRQWLSEVEGCETFTNFLLINVDKSFGIATVDFNTKVKNDIENNKPTNRNIARLLWRTANASDEVHTLRKLPGVQQLHENRRTEIKKLPADKTRGLNSSELVDYIWNDLKLKDNLTSMSKVPGGGSYYVGISELNIVTGGYKTKIPKIEGFEITDSRRITEDIKEKVKDCTCVLVLRDRTFSDTPDDLITVRFHNVPNTAPTRYVLEVHIRFYDGIVFYDKRGPRTYMIQGDEVVRVDKEEWLQRFIQTFEPCVCHN